MRVPPSPKLLSLKEISRHPSEELLHFFQDAATVRMEATITAARKGCQNIVSIISPEPEGMMRING
jgi:hypothetical protein